MLSEFIEQLDKLPYKVMAGCAEIDTKKPLIGIISAQNEVAVTHSSLNEVCERVKEGVIACGASAKIAYVASIELTVLRGTQASKYDLPSRDLTANSVELLCSDGFFDGLVFVASEPNVVAGMMLGAIRLNVPCAFVCQGVMTPILYNNVEHGFTFFYEQIAKIKTGRTPYEAISEVESSLPLALGTDCERYGANSFNCILEALGLAIRGNGTAPATSFERKMIAFKTGELAVSLAKDKLTPRRLLSQASLINVITLDLACGGSSTTMLNLIAIAKELGVKNINFKTIGDLAKSTPLLLSKESATSCLMPQFHKAGGVYAMLKRLTDARLINEKLPFGNSLTLEERLVDVTVNDSNVIRPIERSIESSSTLRTIYGNVAEGGAFVHYRGDTTFTGVAKVYCNEEMAVEALLHREIREGDVLVIRGEGPKSGPGMREIYVSPALLKGYELENKVAVITDGRIADFYDGIAVGHITPETGEQNVFSVLQDGDEIEINIAKGKINCDVKSKELAQRYRVSDVGVGNYANFFLKSWARTCATATEGCVYKINK